MDESAGFPFEIDPSWAGHDHYALRVLAALARDPDRTVLYVAERAAGSSARERAISARDFAAMIGDCAAALARRGVGPDRVVAMLTRTNHPAMLGVRYAAHLLGAAVVCVRSHNPRSDAAMLPHDIQSRLLRDTGASVLVTDADHATAGRLLARDVPGLSLLCLSESLRGEDGGRNTPDTLGGGYDPDRPAVIAFTSGSTGRPKSILQTFRTWNAIVGVFSGSAVPGEPSRILATTPLSHTVGSMVDAVLAHGGSAVLHEGFDAAEVLRTIGALGVTDAYLAVPHLSALVEHPDVIGTDLSSLRRLVYSGSPAAPHRVALAWEVFGDAVVQLYGTSEAGGVSSLTALDHQEPELLGTVGRPFPWVRLQIRDPRSGRPVAAGATGEIWVSSPTAMDGHPDDPALSAQVRRDGWLRTGDLGHWDVYGYLRLVGRVADAIKSGGLKVYPAAVERVLLAHPQVAEAAVVGVSDADLVEHVHAAVVLRPAATCTPADLRAHVLDRLTPHHVPASIRLWDALPLDERGKPDRAALRAHGRPARPLMTKEQAT